MKTQSRSQISSKTDSRDNSARNAHEKKIAEFYSSRIIDMKDGKVVGDKRSSTDNYLDYQLENKISQDMPKHDAYGGKIFSSCLRGLSEAGIKLILRAGNVRRYRW